MRPIAFPFALLAFLGFVAVTPAWIYFTGQLTAGWPEYQRFLIQLTLPGTVLLYLGSWLQPR